MAISFSRMTPGTHFFTRPDGALAYSDVGTGPLVVAMTGMGDLRSQYRFLSADLVAAGFRVVTVDVRGFGESSARWPQFTRAAIAQDYLDLVAHLDSGPAVLVASSYVGGAATLASVIDPEQIAGVVLLGGFIRERKPTIGSRLLARFMASPLSRGLWPSYYASLYTSRKPEDLPEHVAAVRANLAEPGRWVALGRMVLADNSAADARVSEVTRPALVVVGSQDPDFTDPAEEIRYARESFQGEVDGLLVDGAGHYPHVERPDLVSPRIVEFAEAACRAQA
jgi:pimeloyl-ACP methyl ester carboxylesterase